MKNIFLIYLSILIICLIQVSAELCDSFDQFKTICKRIYPSDEEAQRKSIYQAKCKDINQFNQDVNNKYKRSVNCLTGDRDINQPPYGVTLARLKTSTIQKKQTVSETAVGATLPTSYNMVTQKYVTDIQNQGSCGCCWSFAATGLYESDLLLRGYSYGLSEQAALQCTNHYSPDNRISDCSGGYFEDPLYYYGAVGGVLRSKYPYAAASFGSGVGAPLTNGICNHQDRIYIGKGDVKVYGGLSRTQIKTILVNKGSLIIGVYANQAFLDYSSGVFTGCPIDAANFINHAVLLVGYDDSTSSWLVKNQWGTNWGQSGYIRISYINDCGLSSLLGKLQYSQLSANPEVSFAGNSALITQTYLGQTFIKYFTVLTFFLFTFYLF